MRLRLQGPGLAVAALAVVAASRLAAWAAFGVRADPAVVTGHWQHLPLDSLRDGLGRALWDLHSQPPLWNLILGLMAKLCDADAGCVAGVAEGWNVVLTALGAVLLVGLGSWLTGSRRAALALALVYALSPSALFYDAYPFYPATTAFLSLGLGYGAMLWLRDGRLVGAVVAAAALVLLGWTWSLFHPVLVAVVLAALAVSRAGLRGRKLALVVLAVALVLLPSVKNQIRFGFFGNGSWQGLNLATVSPAPLPGCGFGNFLDAHTGAGPPGAVLNDPGIIAVSERCTGEAVAAIRADLAGYLHSLWLRTERSLSRWPSDYFLTPLNWQRFPVPFRLDGHTGLPPDRGVVGRANLALNLGALAGMVWLAIFDAGPGRRRFWRVMLVYLALFLGLGHAFNADEQQRMRYTVHFLFWLAWGVAVVGMVRALNRR